VYCGIGPTNLLSNTLTSGMYPTGYVPSAQLKFITVMFSPGGGIDSVYLNNYSQAPSTTVHFLVGRTDKLNKPLDPNSNHPTNRMMFDPNASNLADPLSLWVSVARSTGIVITSENTPPPIDSKTATPTSITIFSGNSQLQQQLDPTNATGQSIYLSFCRQLATNREQIRGQ